ncbi:MAG: DUF3306 domain-containing protein [Burkholderiaceae bacterium]
MTRGRGGDFWSRRRAAVRDAETRAREQRQAADDARQVARLEEKSDEEILAELGLPDPDTMAEGADFRAFLQRTVPERLRRRALRRLWTLNPVLANLDGLIEYGEDYTDAARVTQGMKSVYVVGRGMVDHTRALEDGTGIDLRAAMDARVAEAVAETGTASDAGFVAQLPVTDPGPSLTDAANWPHTVGESAEEEVMGYRSLEADSGTQETEGEASPARPPRRRMRFS